MVTELTIEQRDRAITLPITLNAGVGAAAPRRTRRAARFEPVSSRVNTNDGVHKGSASAAGQASGGTSEDMWTSPGHAGTPVEEAAAENKNNTKQEIIVGWCLTPPPPRVLIVYKSMVLQAFHKHLLQG